MLHRQDKETKALVDELAALPVFAGLARKAVEALATAGRVVHLPVQWAMISESQPGDSSYVLLTGEAEVRQHGTVVAQLTTGALIGEAALVERRTRNATVVTTTEVRALRLGFEELTKVFGLHPGVEKAFRAEWDKRNAGV